MELRIRFREERLKVFSYWGEGEGSLNSKSLKVTKIYLKQIYMIPQYSTKIMYTPVFNQPFQTCSHYFLIIINDKHPDFTVSAKVLLKGVRRKKNVTLKTDFSAISISVTRETFSGVDGAGPCETEHRTGLGCEIHRPLPIVSKTTF